MVAASTLNIFNNHCDRVKMANIAQMINVLQAMILTDKEKIVLTPTYHVFQLYTVHHDAKLLPCELQSANCGSATDKIPQVNVSASRDSGGKIHVSLCNLDPDNAAEIVCDLRGATPQTFSGRMLTAPEITAHNTFDSPETVKPSKFDAIKSSSTGFAATLPPKSVVVLEAE
jgi:alpha-N-arabinofuranosidase